MVWIFLTRCCSYDSLTWTMETLLGAYTFLLLFEWAAKTWNFVAVVALFLNALLVCLCVSLFFFFILYSHTFFACRIALSCFLQWYEPNVSSFSQSVCVRVLVLAVCTTVYVCLTVNVCMCVVWQAQHMCMYLFDIFAR